MTENKLNKLYLDENLIRVVAMEVAIISSFALLFQNKLIALFLIVDFALRAFTHQTSPLGYIAKLFKTMVVPKPIFAPPKKFAAALGFVFSLSILILFVLEFNIPALVVGGLLIGCALLESVLKICVGCYIYTWFVAPFKN